MNANAQLPTRWLYFLNYVKLPIAGLLNMALFFKLLVSDPLQRPLVPCIYLAISLLSCTAAIGLNLKAIWGMYLVLFIIATDCVIPPLTVALNRGGGAFEVVLAAGIYILVLLTVWFYPNWVYFKKRRSLFLP